MESNTTGAEMSIADKVNPEQLTVSNFVQAYFS